MHIKLTNINKNIKSSLLKKKHNKHITKNFDFLTQIIDSIVHDLIDYEARVLSIVECSGELFSEQMNFFSKIINGENVLHRISTADISNELLRSIYAMRSNFFIIKSPEGKYKFCSIFTIKSHTEVSLRVIDNLLSSGDNVILSQAAYFVKNIDVKNSFQKMADTAQIANDAEFIAESGIQNILSTDLNSNSSEDCHFINHQLNLIIYEDTLDRMNQSITNLIKKCSKYGIIIVREDLNMESSFYSLVPGNFSYLLRTNYNHKSKLGEFAYCEEEVDEKSSRYLWNNIICKFNKFGTTKQQIFYIPKNVSTIIISGKQSSGKDVLLNFLVSQMMRYTSNGLLYLDTKQTSQSFITALGGKSKFLSTNSKYSEIEFNPFVDLKGEKSSTYLKNLFLLLFHANGSPLSDNDNDKLDQIVKIIVNNPKKYSSMQTIRELLFEYKIEDRIIEWHSVGTKAHLISGEDNTDLNENILRIAIARNIVSNAIFSSLLMYIILHQTLKILSKKKRMILVIKDAFHLLNDNLLGPIIEKMSKAALKNESVIIFTNKLTGRDVIKSKCAKNIVSSAGMQIHLGNENANNEYKQAFKLSYSEIKAILDMGRNPFERGILVKVSKTERFAVSFDMSIMPDKLDILSDNIEVKKMIDEISHQVGSKKWLDVFYETSLRKHGLLKEDEMDTQYNEYENFEEDILSSI